MNSLLPPNATPQETALAGTTERIDAIPVKTRQTWNPQTCPAELLPWLAWALSVDEWNADWSEQQKRDTIAASFRIHSTKGTLAAVKTSLAALGYDTNVIEWFQQPGELDPYTFTVDIDAALNPITGDIFNEATRLIDQTKNTRSHLARLRVATSAPVNYFAAAAQLYGIYCATGGSLSPIETVPPPPVVVRYFAIGNIQGDVRVYKVEGQTFTALANPDVMPSSTGSNLIYSVDFSPNADYLVVGCNQAPYIYIYKRTGDTFTKLPNPAVLPDGPINGQGARFSPDGNFLAVSHLINSTLKIYSRSGDTFTKLPDPASAVGFSVCGWNRDGTYLVTGASMPSVYARTGSTFSKIANPSTALPGDSRAAAFSPVSDLLVCAHGSAPRVSVSSITAGIHTRHADPAVLPTSTANCVAFNHDGTIVVVGADDGLFIYTVSGTTLTRIANPSGSPTNIRGVAFNHDGTILTVGTGGSPYFWTYSVSGTTFTQISNPPAVPVQSTFGVDFS